MKNIQIKCPSCSKSGSIEVSPELLKNAQRGIIAINIEKKVCTHSFVVYIDKNYAIRDCLLIDFQIDLPQLMSNQTIREKDIIKGDNIDIDLIKINYSVLTITLLIRNCLLKKKITFLDNKEFLFDHLLTFFNYIFQNTFKIELSNITNDTYKQNKKQFKDHLIIDGINITPDKRDIIDYKKAKIEKYIIYKFLAEYDPEMSIKFLKNEIQNMYMLAKDTMNIIESYIGEEKIGKRYLIDKLEEKAIAKISFSYLELLLDIIKNYFDFDLSILSDHYFPQFGI